MKVLIDLTSLADNFSGIERFALSITKELISDQSRSDIEYILVFKNEVHKEFAEEQHNVKKIIVRGKNKLIFNQLQLPLKLATIKADYYFFPAFPAPFFFFDRNAISAIHDVGCWDCPSKNKKYMTLYFKLMYRKAALGHKKVVTVSQFSKNRISKILKKESDEIAVIYDGLSDCFANFYYDRGQDIPKIIHYCWLSGDEVPENLKKCMDSWKKIIPDYEFVKWDFTKFDKSSSAWVSEAFDNRGDSRICSVCCIEYINEKSANVGGNQHDKAKNS